MNCIVLYFHNTEEDYINYLTMPEIKTYGLF